MSTDARFAGRVAIVTGAGGGIGQAVVHRLLAGGALVVAADRDGAGLARLPLADDRLVTVEGDLAGAAHCADLVGDTVERRGRLDILVNNAGLMRRGDILATSEADWTATLDVNVTAVFRLCRAAIAQMRARGGGAIVNVASTWGVYPGPGHLAYCTSKAAVAAMTRCLGRDHAPDGIRVNAVCPNEVDTPMLRTGFEVRGLDPARALEQLGETVPLGRVATPGDIADVIAFLACDEARYVAGALVEVSGAKAVY